MSNTHEDTYDEEDTYDTYNEATKEYFVSTPPVPTTCHPSTFLAGPIVTNSITTSPEHVLSSITSIFAAIRQLTGIKSQVSLRLVSFTRLPTYEKFPSGAST
jgi:hypothetical protein